MEKHSLVIYGLALLIFAVVFVGTAAPQETSSADITISVNDSSNGVDQKTLPITIDGNSTSSDPGSSPGSVQLRATNAPQVVQPNETYSVTYEVKNDGQGSTAYTVRSQTNRSNVTVVDFTGDIRSKTPSANPPSASTDSVDVDQTIQFSVDYEVAASTTGTAQITTSAIAPISGNSDEATVTSTIREQTTPTDPTQRVLQVTDKQQASQLTQNDVTTLITLKSRDSTQNGVTVSQNDVTTVITLFARNN